MECRGTRNTHNKLEEAGTCQKQLETGKTKKSLLHGGQPIRLIVIQWFWIALIFNSNKVLHHRLFKSLEKLDIVDCIGKYFLLGKMAFC